MGKINTGIDSSAGKQNEKGNKYMYYILSWVLLQLEAFKEPNVKNNDIE